MRSNELQVAILLLLNRHSERSSTVDDTEIVKELGASIEDVHRQLDILAAQGLTTPVNTYTNHSAYITPKGMALAEELQEAGEEEAPSKRPIGFN